MKKSSSIFISYKYELELSLLVPTNLIHFPQFIAWSAMQK